MEENNEVLQEQITEETAIENEGNAQPNEKDNAEKMIPVSEMQKRIAREKAKYEADLVEKVTKAEKLAKMSEKEREEAEENDRIKALDEKERELNLREYRYQAKRELEAVDLSDKFVDMVLSDDVEVTKQNIASLKTNIAAEVERQVTERLKGKPVQTTTGSNGITKSEIMAIKDTKKRQELIKENIQLFK